MNRSTRCLLLAGAVLATYPVHFVVRQWTATAVGLLCLAVAGIALMPLHRMMRRERRRQVSVACPECGHPRTESAGVLACPECGQSAAIAHEFRTLRPPDDARLWSMPPESAIMLASSFVPMIVSFAATLATGQTHHDLSRANMLAVGPCGFLVAAAVGYWRRGLR